VDGKVLFEDFRRAMEESVIWYRLDLGNGLGVGAVT
jgi:hypothetical protein